MIRKTYLPIIHTSNFYKLFPARRLPACCIFLLALFAFTVEVKSQTDFAPGEIMFTGYKSDDADAFSIVLLAPVVSGTVIYITDWGWSNSSGYRVDNNGEGLISYTFAADYPCGTEFFFNDVGGANDWAVTNVYGVAVGTVSIQSGGDADGMELGLNGANSSGDQLTIYQLPQPTSGDQASFICMIQMDNNPSGAVDTDEESELPTGLPANAIVRFNTEYDNAKYDCTPYTDSATNLRTAITNDNGSGGLKLDNANNWIEADANSITLGPCYFCCGSTPPAAAPTLSAPWQVNTNATFTISITGTLASGASWQLYTAGCGVGTPIQTTMSNSFTVTAPSTEGYVTYYVRSSQVTDCSGICSTVTVHFCNSNTNTCTNCSADPTVCGNCLLPYPADNPALDSGCYALKVVFILDESGSMNGFQTQVKNAVLAFLNALNGQDAQVALIEFSNLATVVNTYTTSNQAYIDAVTGYFNGNPPLNGQTYVPNGGTNWHDAMIKLDAMDPPDLVIFLTDGEPTGWTNGSTADPCGNWGSTQTPEIVNPVKLSNKVKGEGTHMFMYGVGSGVSTTNLQYMSGYDNYVSGVNTIATADYSIGGFANLAADLANFINELCRVDIEISKTVLGPVCNDTVIFQFIIYNLSDESATNLVFIGDTMPAGYTPLSFYSNDPTHKVCPFNFVCDPPQPANAFLWIAQPVPPLSSDTIWVICHVNAGGPFTNDVWAESDNASEIVSDTFPGSQLTYDQPPTITCPANITIQCNASTLPANTGTPIATDPDGPTPILTYNDVTAAGSCPVTKIITRTWFANDGCNPLVNCIQTITLIDTSPPVITCPANTTVNCGSNTSPGVTGTATAVDACDPTVVIAYSDVTVAGTCPAEYTIHRIWSATDDCGNSSTCQQNIFLDDNVGPELTCNPVNISCEMDPGPANTGYPTVTNNCGGTSTLTYTDVFIFMPTPPQCSINRTWTATDNCGNTSTCLQQIVVKDNFGPAIFCPANVTIACSASTLPGNTGSATATDNCAISPSIAYTDVVVTSPTCPQNKTITRTWSATDECGNTTSCNQTITVVDLIAPSITCPANITVLCTASTLPANTGNPTSVDNCDATPTITFTDVTLAGSCPQKYTITRTWKSQDDCGNFNTCNQIINVTDNIGPAVTCPANITILCTASTLPANTGTATATDNCSASPVVTFTDATIAGPCTQTYTITRTWKGTDACGNFNTCNQTIFITDNVAPAITCPANITILCTQSTLPVTTGNPTSTDNCDASPIITFTDVTTSGSCPQSYTIARTWKSTDHCGNFITCVQSISVVDNVAPSITCPNNITILCTQSTLPVTTGNPTSTDNCDITPTITFTDITTAGSCPQSYTIARTWKSQDDCGNFITCNQTITVLDNIGPSINCPANITVLCSASTLPANTGNPTSSDNCDATPTITFTDVTVAGSCPQKYTITRTWKSQDDCGNFNTCNQIISVTDNVGPTVTCPANITILCTASTLPANTGTGTATDNCSASPVVTYTDATIAGPCAQTYTITRTWKGTDACGNFNTCNQTIFITDNVAPAITCPANITILCTQSTLPVTTGNPTSTDNCDASPVITFTDVTTSGSCPQTYTIARTWKSTDHCDNFITCVQSISVVDNVAPSITCPNNITILCTQSTLPVITGNPTSTDNCDISPTITFTDITTAGSCPQAYSITRTWKSEDDCGNFITCNQTITVVDNIGPSISCPANITVQCSASTLPANTGNPTSSDNCDATPTITFTDVTVAGSCPNKYVITRTWKSTDDCANFNTCNQIITVTDNVGPAITCPANLTIECTASTLPAATGSMTATDNCDASPVVTYADVTTASPTCPQEYSIARTWTATDICGNTTTCLQNIIVDDSNPPAITCPVDVTIECTSSTLPANTGNATSTDNCDLTPGMNYSDVTVSVPGTDGYLIHRTWTTTDDCGNNSTCLQNILVTNPLNPEILGDPFDTICSGQMVVFQAFDQGITPITYSWTFGSGSSPSSASGIGPHTITYTYNAQNGSVGAWVVLTVTTPGCPPVTDTVANVNVNSLPPAAITVTPPGNPCIFGQKTFVPTAPQVSGYTYLWDFGAGAIPATSNTYGPHTVEYSTAGAKTVKLIVWTNEAGASCADSSTVTFTVNTCPGSITGRVYLDTQTSDTTGIANVTVRLYADNNLDGIQDNGVIIRTVTSNAQGRWSMASVTPGYYVIVEIQPSGYFSLWDDDTSEDFDSLSNIVPNDNIIPCTVESSEVDTRNFFVEVVSPGIINGYVFDDMNADQAPQPAEGIPGVAVHLHVDANADGVPDGASIANATTNNVGFYTMGAGAGNYVLVESQPSGYDNVLDIDPTNDGDVVQNTNMTDDIIPVTLTNAEVDGENFFIEDTPCNQYVTTTQDSVAGSLRFAIACAQDWDTIFFSQSLANQIVHITAGRIEINKNLYIYSNVNPTIMVNSENIGAFKILSNAYVEFKGINFTSGTSGFPGAQFENYGQLILWDCQVFRNPNLGPTDYLIFNQAPAEFTIKGTFQLHD